MYENFDNILVKYINKKIYENSEMFMFFYFLKYNIMHVKTFYVYISIENCNFFLLWCRKYVFILCAMCTMYVQYALCMHIMHYVCAILYVCACIICMHIHNIR